MSVVEYGDGQVGLAVGEDEHGNVYVAPLALELHRRDAISGDPGLIGLRNYPKATDRTADDGVHAPEPVVFDPVAGPWPQQSTATTDPATGTPSSNPPPDLPPAS